MNEAIRIHPFDLYELMQSLSLQEIAAVPCDSGIFHIKGQQYVEDTQIPPKTQRFAFTQSCRQMVLVRAVQLIRAIHSRAQAFRITPKA